MDRRGVVIAMRRPSQKAWWVARKYLRERVRYIVREHILLDAIPYVKQEMASRLEDSLCLTVARLAVMGKHYTQLATNEIVSSILERQRQCIVLPAAHAIVDGLSHN